MKITSTMLFLIACLFALAQDTTIDIKVKAPASARVVTPAYINQDKIFTVVEQMPQFPGGEEQMMKFIQANIQYPKMEMENDIQGRVVVGFVVKVDGSLSDISIKKSVSKGIDEEALRVVRLMPNFSPGRQRGNPVDVSFVLPTMFKLTTAEPARKK